MEVETKSPRKFFRFGQVKIGTVEPASIEAKPLPNGTCTPKLYNLTAKRIYGSVYGKPTVVENLCADAKMAYPTMVSCRPPLPAPEIVLANDFEIEESNRSYLALAEEILKKANLFSPSVAHYLSSIFEPAPPTAFQPAHALPLRFAAFEGAPVPVLARAVPTLRLDGGGPPPPSTPVGGCGFDLTTGAVAFGLETAFALIIELTPSEHRERVRSIMRFVHGALALVGGACLISTVLSSGWIAALSGAVAAVIGGLLGHKFGTWLGKKIAFALYDWRLCKHAAGDLSGYLNVDPCFDCASAKADVVMNCNHAIYCLDCFRRRLAARRDGEVLTCPACAAVIRSGFPVPDADEPHETCHRCIYSGHCQYPYCPQRKTCSAFTVLVDQLDENGLPRQVLNRCEDCGHQPGNVSMRMDVMPDDLTDVVTSGEQ